MKIIKSSFLICLIVAITAGCDKDLTELNDDTKNPTEIPGEYLFTNAQKALSDQTASTNVNRNIFKLWAQYWTECQYPDESQYDLAKRNIPRSVWSVYYKDVLSDLNRAKILITSGTILDGLPPVELARETAVRDNKIAIADILMVFTYARLIDTFGDVPYTQALDIEATTTPAYDDAQTIYEKLFVRLDADIAVLKLNSAEASYFPEQDKLYSGNIDSWIIFANSLKFRMAVTVADVPELTPGARAQAAIADGIISSVAEAAMYPYESGVPNTNPLWEDLVASGRKDFVAANTLVDYMNDLEDPRRQYYFDSNITDTIAGEVVPIYKGGTYGSTNVYAINTQVNLQFRVPTYPNAMMTYSEMLFYRAEGAANPALGLGGDVETLYNEAITSSIVDDWAGSQADADTYLARADVAYSTAPGASWKEKIAMQEWIAFYMRGFEGWTTWRRLDAPVMNAPVTLLPGESMPTRFNYPIEEQTLNNANWAAAAAAIGGDDKETKLFWDKY